MFARLHLLSAVAALVLLGCSTQALNMNSICALVSDDSLIASENSLSTYYLCKGAVATLQTCSNGLHFDKDAQKCTPANESNGSVGGQNACAGQKVDSWVSKPGSCTAFYYCSANGAVLSHCPSGMNFDPNAQMCMYHEKFPCDDTNGNDGSNTASDIHLCSFVQNDVYFGSPTSCKEWNLCVKNVLNTADCENNLYYNVAAGQCDYQSSTKCTQVTNDPDLIPSNGGPCTNDGEKIPSPRCDSYYQCVDTNLKLIPCPKETEFFDTGSKTCVDRMHAHNDCDRCVGTKKSFVNQHSTNDCSGYIYCENGVAHSRDKCPTDTYFNEIAGYCSPDTPNFRCCNPNAVIG